MKKIKNLFKRDYNGNGQVYNEVVEMNDKFPKQWSREKPLTDKELTELRNKIIDECVDLIEFSCYNCKFERLCCAAYVEYNTDGDCIIK